MANKQAQEDRIKPRWTFGIIVTLAIVLAASLVGYGMMKMQVETTVATVATHETRVDALESNEAGAKARSEERWEFIKGAVERIDRRQEAASTHTHE
jgi:Flp pilus assembly protein TadB